MPSLSSGQRISQASNWYVLTVSWQFLASLILDPKGGDDMFQRNFG
jgi:hypothetical protein